MNIDGRLTDEATYAKKQSTAVRRRTARRFTGYSIPATDDAVATRHSHGAAE